MKIKARQDALTGDLFAIPRPVAPVDGAMNYRKTVSALVGDMLNGARVAGLDRYEVAAKASRLAGRDVSKAMLDGYTAESRDEFNVPLWLAPVLEVVCDSTQLTEWLADVRGGRFLVGAATLDAEIGRRSREMDIAAAELKQLRELRRRVR
ncbi:hypothetical protein [Stenotrophomonas sp. B1-1]|uniref:hypothetical protein n=1 Tax=Stenotrophomonas sp. B1-1 TaxID=2710648 RepID=UPI0013D93D15|nr:hypothetical protein [Stenotrophomonas sp. B1-1]